MADRIQLRRDTAANWTAYNPILLEGEPGIEIDTDQWKLGDGVHTWSQLAYRGGECVQQRGQSTTAAMSQKAVTDELNLIGVFDISAYNLTNGQPTKYADLETALGTHGDNIPNIPESFQRPGMLVKFIKSSTNKYALYRLKTPSFSTSPMNWENIINNGFLYVTYLMNCSISLVYNNDTTATCTITRQGSQGYIYHEQGWLKINSASIVSNLQLLDELNIIYFDAIAQEVKVTGNIEIIDDNCVVFEIFYAYRGTPMYGCWTTPLISKTGLQMQNNVLSLVKPSILSDITSLQTRTTNLEARPWNFHCATNWFGSEFKVVYNGTNHTISTVVTVQSQSGTCYLWFENGSIQIPLSKLAVTLEVHSVTNMQYLYAIQNIAGDDPAIFLTNDKSTIPSSAVIIDIFYTWIGVNPRAFWTTDFIPHEGFPSNYANGSVSYFNPKNMKDLQNRVSVLENIGAKRAFPYSIKAFRRVGCIGDSYTKGYIYPSGGSVTEDENYAWPHFMETFTKNKYSNWGVSGSTAKGWMSGAAKLAQVQANGNKCQAYIIGLMINDRIQSAWNQYYTPVGVITDIGTDNDTYYAWYYKLIQAVVVVNPDAPIFCNTCPRYSDSDAYNQAVRDIVKYCHDDGQKVYLNDLTNSKYSDLFSNPTFVADSVNGHYTAIGYEYMAECLKEIVSDTINSNISEFQNIHLIPFDNN